MTTYARPLADTMLTDKNMRMLVAFSQESASTALRRLADELERLRQGDEPMYLIALAYEYDEDGTHAVMGTLEEDV